MLNRILIVARQELTCALRDTRPLLSSLFYCLMGPGVVFMVSLAMNGKTGASEVVIGMMSVFALVSAFSGGMNVAIDVLAGERERQSLLPLLMNGVPRRDVLLGKWLAIVCFAAASLLLNLVLFGLVLGRTHNAGVAPVAGPALLLATGLLPLALLAAAVEVCVSTFCRSMKEAHTWLSMLVFLPMGLGLFAVFFPQASRGWALAAPLLGQQWQIEQWWRGGDLPAQPGVALAVATVTLTAFALWAAARLLERDDVVYGG